MHILWLLFYCLAYCIVVLLALPECSPTSGLHMPTCIVATFCGMRPTSTSFSWAIHSKVQEKPALFSAAC
eukprot:1512686-Amphidinium_carterae.3